MAFSLPLFNVSFDAWTGGHVPAVDAPDSVDNPCQLYLNAKFPADQADGDPAFYTPTIFLRIPLLGYRPIRGDIVQVRPPTVDYYKVRWIQNVHIGFPNEYIAAAVEQCNAVGATPRP